MGKDKKATYVWGIASLVLSIIGLMLFLAPYIGIICSILAVVFYGIQKKHKTTGVATAGLVVGIIGTVINTVILLFIVGLFVLYSSGETYEDEILQSTDNSVTSQAVDQNDGIEEKSVEDETLVECPTGEKVKDWFDCNLVRQMLSIPTHYKTADCSDPRNSNLTKVSFEIMRVCKLDDGSIVEYASNPKRCSEKWDGEYKLFIGSDAYPSLNEYVFLSAPIPLKNLGCTKIDLSNLEMVYTLYQDGNIIDHEVKEFFTSSDLRFRESNFLYPGKSVMPQAGFGKYNKGITRKKPNGFTFKICLIDTAKNNLIDCDEGDFTIEYEN